MKFYKSHILLVFVALFVAGLTLQAEVKVGVIDLRKVFDNYWKTKEADKQLKERAKGFEEQRNKLLDSYKTANEDYKKLVQEANAPIVSEEERTKRKDAAEKKLREIQQLETQIQQFDRSARSTLGEQQRRMRDDVLRDIRKVIDRLAEQSNYTLVIDIAAESVNNTPVILYNNTQNDMTEKVLEELNSTAPVGLLKEEGSAEGESGPMELSPETNTLPDDLFDTP
ncbi:MAG: OmpH family outer membrane protein [Verrucomicrobia bacterium]|nr:OmpH family outer membrane protein [Verrucomicrobiota bacterium]MCF7708115.1 OmpH family outer membrane protein [Verrucomicrobiota bacterium]